MANADFELSPLAPLLASCDGAPFPRLNADEEIRLELEYRHLRNLIAKGIPIYGGNRRPGHRETEHESSEQALSNQILQSHAIGDAPWCDQHQARSMSVAKLAMWRAGGSGVSLKLYNRVLDLLSDSEFQPLIPRRNSYSAGDVIPAAHWAQAILSGSPKTGAYAGHPEIMAMINGAFIHAGIALNTIPLLRDAWVLFFENTVAYMHSLRNNSFLRIPRVGLAPAAETASKLLRHATSNSPLVAGLQDSISLRATDEVFETLLEAVDRMAQRLAESLQRPSCNPLISVNHNNGISQASFFLPTLSVAQSALIDALLFAMWAQVGRTTFLLSGDVPKIPSDGATLRNPLGLIQYPKQMMALLEEARAKGSRSVYSSGGSTSHGIEDLWSNGITTTEILAEICKCFFRMSSIEACVLRYLQQEGLIWIENGFGIVFSKDSEVSENLKSSSIYRTVTKKLKTNPDYPKYGFPINF